MDIKNIPEASLSAVKNKDREGWLALFAEDAIVEDPVGPSDWDAEGKGQRGSAAIAAFYDMFAAFQDALNYEIHHMVARGNEAAAFTTLQITMKDGAITATKVINIYKFSQDGKISSLRSFWNA